MQSDICVRIQSASQYYWLDILGQISFWGRGKPQMLRIHNWCREERRWLRIQVPPPPRAYCLSRIHFGVQLTPRIHSSRDQNQTRCGPKNSFGERHKCNCRYVNVLSLIWSDDNGFCLHGCCLTCKVFPASLVFVSDFQHLQCLFSFWCPHLTPVDGAEAGREAGSAGRILKSREHQQPVLSSYLHIGWGGVAG